ncbi:unnamed protein product [Trifolium pratense]|uniref:Uncharacterized protein n=1 Tax=Trifolium pratense TaxID=57577 RepID=A0ACB0JRY2_TRIPR|nr:unnamed protein product [Trifolium pratense]
MRRVEKIHTTVRKQLIYMFDWKLEEGQVYEMPCFAVLPESGLYRTTLHPYKLAFQSKAKGVEASKETRILLAWLIVLRGWMELL